MWSRTNPLKAAPLMPGEGLFRWPARAEVSRISWESFVAIQWDMKTLLAERGSPPRVSISKICTLESRWTSKGMESLSILPWKWKGPESIEQCLKLRALQMQVMKTHVIRDFPGGTVVKTLYSRCRGPGFDPWLGS